MMPFMRGDEPECLKKSPVYLRRYLNRIKKYEDKQALGQKVNKPSFPWPTHNKVRLNHHLVGIFEGLNGNHCSYCDGFPLGTLSRSTIDHFKPKEHFPHLAYEWGNLYLCCDRCQSCKLTKFDDLLLRPDEPGFEFSEYFLLNFRSGEIEVNPFASSDHQNRAQVTLAILDLNDKEPGPRAGRLPKERIRVLELKTSVAVEFRAYRFLY